ncbi:hypothetical protein WJX74_004294 [Apatococcus lobatus]|uniref:FAD/NAD(P)-binding domain-containing protein n=1 Tax=Apatococcus lobatus TaxID=904363 RepID=A0AAW1RLI0_9CHLO
MKTVVWFLALLSAHITTLAGQAILPGRLPHVAVIGAGPQGVVAALELGARGCNVTLFEKETIILPIVETIQLDGFVYEYLSQLLIGGATFSGFGPPEVVSAFASKYGQPLEPLPASNVSLYFGSGPGLTTVPSFWLPLLATPDGRQTLVQQLAAGVAILQQLDAAEPTPAGVLQLGIVASPSQSFTDWAAQTKLPAFTDFVASFINSALSGPAGAAPAAHVLLDTRLYILGGLRRTFLSLGIAPSSATAQAAGIDSLLQGGPESTSLFHFPRGARVLFETAVASSSITLRLGVPVSAVSNDGLVTFYGGQQRFDYVISSLRPEPAAAILSAPLSQAFAPGQTGLVDLWIFNASVAQPTSAIGSQLLQPFIAARSTGVAGLAAPGDGSPSYILRLDPGSPFVCAGAYVAPNTTQASTTNVVVSNMAAYGFNVASTVQYSRVQFPSTLPIQPALNSFGKVFLLGEAVSGIGIATALEYVPAQINAWVAASAIDISNVNG